MTYASSTVGCSAVCSRKRMPSGSGKSTNGSSSPWVTSPWAAPMRSHHAIHCSRASSLATVAAIGVNPASDAARGGSRCSPSARPEAKWSAPPRGPLLPAPHRGGSRIREPRHTSCGLPETLLMGEVVRDEDQQAGAASMGSPPRPRRHSLAPSFHHYGPPEDRTPNGAPWAPGWLGRSLVPAQGPPWSVAAYRLP